MQPVVAGCIIVGSTAVPLMQCALLPWSWNSFCRTQKGWQVQSTHLVLLSGTTGAQTQDPKPDTLTVMPTPGLVSLLTRGCDADTLLHRLGKEFWNSLLHRHTKVLLFVSWYFMSTSNYCNHIWDSWLNLSTEGPRALQYKWRSFSHRTVVCIIYNIINVYNCMVTFDSPCIYILYNGLPAFSTRRTIFI